MCFRGRRVFELIQSTKIQMGPNFYFEFWQYYSFLKDFSVTE